MTSEAAISSSNLTSDKIYEFNREFDRLQSFNIHKPNYHHYDILAKIGFYALNNEEVICYFCKLSLKLLSDNIDCVEFHLRYSPTCSLLRKKETNNLPINEKELDDLIPKSYSDYCGSYATTPKFHVEYPQYQYYSVRLESFKNWPQANIKPSKLAEAGFFYTGKSDKVVCISCEGGIQSWKEDNDPWEMHALYYSNCEYVRLEKGMDFINNIRIKNGKKSLELLELSKTPNSNLLETSTSASTSDEIKSSGVEEITKSQTDRLCKKCHNNQISILFLPCSDAILCENCSEEVTHCLKCATKIVRKIKIFL